MKKKLSIAFQHYLLLRHFYLNKLIVKSASLTLNKKSKILNEITKKNVFKN